MNEKNPVCNSRVNKLTTDSRTSNKESRGKPLSESVEMLEAFKKEKRDKSKPKRESFAD